MENIEENYLPYQNLIKHYYYVNEIPVGVINNITVIGNEKEFLLKIRYIKDDVERTIVKSREEMIYLLKELKERIERADYLKSRNITNLCHFTNLENLDTILEYGLLSLTKLNSENIEYKYTDEIRIDGKRNYICNSISFPNYKMFYKKRLENPDTKWAVLKLNKDIILHKLSTEFYRSNAASNASRFGIANKTSNEALKDLFYTENRDTNIPKNYPTDPQAEVLVKEIITPDYISEISLYNHDDNIQSKCLGKEKIYRVNKQLFSYRSDYERWR